MKIKIKIDSEDIINLAEDVEKKVMSEGTIQFLYKIVNKVDKNINKTVDTNDSLIDAIDIFSCSLVKKEGVRKSE